ncbi:sodium:proton antiporter [Spongiibacter taiwanensis]|uniref:cation:proton antiporter n=1 Tax=Spongiibacter taiwanensis TaxID=1748242 RepID=UPI00203619D1|nr:sodium:proton antiporter [Spongiibacter taiwanensis]USA43496.1 sodium:proton antiporter [Spongiibacter taiwanensis]
MTTSLAAVLVAGIFCQWLAWRFRLPAIVLLAAGGLLLGPISGWLQPQQEFGEGLRAVTSLFVAIILFEGGLNLQFHELRETAKVTRRLTSIGVVLAWGIGTLAAHYIGGLQWGIAALLGAILVVTGPTVIMPLLKHAKLNRRTASYLKWEGIINDPIGVLLAVLVYQYLLYSGEGPAFGHILASLGLAAGVSLVLGGGVAWTLGALFRRGWIPEYLKAPSIIASVLAVYAISDLVQHESGLLATTLMGIVMGNMRLRSLDEMRRFKEYITLVLVSFLFVVLTASLTLEDLRTIHLPLVVMVAAFLLVVRPLAVFLATIGTGCDWRDRLLVGWIAPRGVVAAASAGAFAPALIDAGFEDARYLVPAVFMIIFTTVIAHGFSLGPLTKFLKLRSPGKGKVLIVGASPWSVELALVMKKMKQDVIIADSEWGRLQNARQQGVDTWFGEVLSDMADEALALDNVYTVLAATGNNHYNSMVCNHYAPHLGRHRVFQPYDSGDERQARTVAETRRGVTAFSERVSYAELWTRLIRGWHFRKTTITDTFTEKQFLQNLAEGSIRMAVKRDDGKLQWLTQDERKFQEGDTIISFVPPEVTKGSEPEQEPTPRQEAINRQNGEAAPNKPLP